MSTPPPPVLDWLPETTTEPTRLTKLDRALHDLLHRLGRSQSAAALLREGLDSFAVRVATARSAGRSLDLQFYMWHGDITGRLLAGEVLDAADRGVRVRLLLDDAYALGRERVLSALDAHPGIEVRLFNGTRWRMFGKLGFLMELVFGGWHLNRRMHNKNWVADGCIAIAGGRNIGDEYFGAAGGEFNFRDMDLALAGRAAAGNTRVFQQYWDSPLARRAERVSAHKKPGTALPWLRRNLARARLDTDAQRYLAHLRKVLGDTPHLGRGMVALPPGAVQIVADPPEKARRGLAARRRARAAGGIAPEIADALRQAQSEALLISPYFVPGKAGLALMLEMAARGVKIAVVTNSLAATDVVAVHGGYARYRHALLQAGIELFELRPSGEEEGTSLFGSRGASLHTKAFVVDRALSFVGSFNLDPRSAALNTEMGTFVQHDGLAEELRAEHERLAHPSRSWRLGLHDGKLSWCTIGMDGQEQLLWREPEASLKRRAIARIMASLPLESQL